MSSNGLENSISSRDNGNTDSSSNEMETNLKCTSENAVSSNNLPKGCINEVDSRERLKKAKDLWDLRWKRWWGYNWNRKRRHIFKIQRQHMARRDKESMEQYMMHTVPVPGIENTLNYNFIKSNTGNNTKNISFQEPEFEVVEEDDDDNYENTQETNGYTRNCIRGIFKIHKPSLKSVKKMFSNRISKLFHRKRLAENLIDLDNPRIDGQLPHPISPTYESIHSLSGIPFLDTGNYFGGCSNHFVDINFSRDVPDYNCLLNPPKLETSFESIETLNKPDIFTDTNMPPVYNTKVSSSDKSLENLGKKLNQFLNDSLSAPTSTQKRKSLPSNFHSKYQIPQSRSPSPRYSKTRQIQGQNRPLKKQLRFFNTNVNFRNSCGRNYKINSFNALPTDIFPKPGSAMQCSKVGRQGKLRGEGDSSQEHTDLHKRNQLQAVANSTSNSKRKKHFPKFSHHENKVQIRGRRPIEKCCGHCKSTVTPAFASSYTKRNELLRKCRHEECCLGKNFRDGYICCCDKTNVRNKAEHDLIKKPITEIDQEAYTSINSFKEPMHSDLAPTMTLGYGSTFYTSPYWLLPRVPFSKAFYTSLTNSTISDMSAKSHVPENVRFPHCQYFTDNFSNNLLHDSPFPYLYRNKKTELAATIGTQTENNSNIINVKEDKTVDNQSDRPISEMKAKNQKYLKYKGKVENFPTCKTSEIGCNSKVQNTKPAITTDKIEYKQNEKENILQSAKNKDLQRLYRKNLMKDEIKEEYFRIKNALKTFNSHTTGSTIVQEKSTQTEYGGLGSLFFYLPPSIDNLIHRYSTPVMTVPLGVTMSLPFQNDADFNACNLINCNQSENAFQNINRLSVAKDSHNSDKNHKISHDTSIPVNYSYGSNSQSPQHNYCSSENIVNDSNEILNSNSEQNVLYPCTTLRELYEDKLSKSSSVPELFKNQNIKNVDTQSISPLTAINDQEVIYCHVESPVSVFNKQDASHNAEHLITISQEEIRLYSIDYENLPDMDVEDQEVSTPPPPPEESYRYKICTPIIKKSNSIPK